MHLAQAYVQSASVIEGNEKDTGLKYRYRITDPSAPLFLLVHGKAGTFDVMWAFRRCIPEHCSIIAPQAPLPDPIGGFSWWLVQQDGRRELGQAESSAGLLLSFLERAMQFHHLTPQRRLAYGFSQGAALLSVVSQRKENSFDGIALLAGFVIRQDAPVKTKNSRILQLHGTRDEVVPLDLAVKGGEYLETLGYQRELVADAVGHKIGPAAVRRLTSWTAEILTT